MFQTLTGVPNVPGFGHAQVFSKLSLLIRQLDRVVAAQLGPGRSLVLVQAIVGKPECVERTRALGGSGVGQHWQIGSQKRCSSEQLVETEAGGRFQQVIHSD